MAARHGSHFEFLSKFCPDFNAIAAIFGPDSVYLNYIYFRGTDFNVNDFGLFAVY